MADMAAQPNEEAANHHGAVIAKGQEPVRKRRQPTVTGRRGGEADTP